MYLLFILGGVKKELSHGTTSSSQMHRSS